MLLLARVYRFKHDASDFALKSDKVTLKRTYLTEAYYYILSWLQEAANKPNNESISTLCTVSETICR